MTLAPAIMSFRPNSSIRHGVNLSRPNDSCSGPSRQIMPGS